MGGGVCPVRIAYVDDGAGELVLRKHYGLVLNSDRPEGIFPGEMTVRVEVIDAEARHAVDERTVFVPEPPRLGGGDAGVDGGTRDGGSRDAGAGADGGRRDGGESARAPR